MMRASGVAGGRPAPRGSAMMRAPALPVAGGRPAPRGSAMMRAPALPVAALFAAD